MHLLRTQWEVAQWLVQKLPTIRYNGREWLKFNENWAAITQDQLIGELAATIQVERAAIIAQLSSLSEGDADRAKKQIQLLGGYLNYWPLLGLAKLLQGAAVQTEGWDNQDHCFVAGTRKIDLKTGLSSQVKLTDQFTRYTQILYNPAAPCPRWLKFLDEITKGNTELINYLQRAVGYTLTGHTYEQVLFILVGPGSNGKNIFLEVLYDLFGGSSSSTFSHQTTFKVLERAYGGESAPGTASPHLAALEGCRFVMASESHEGSFFNDGLVKSLTGDAHITARQLHQHEKVFRNKAKFWLACNNLPRVSDTTLGFWRRLQIVQLDRIFQDKDKDLYLRDKLRAELPGILNWAIAGALEWTKSGLQPPAQVGQAVQQYRKGSDTLSAFLDECCYIGEGVHTVRKSLHAAYKSFAREELGHKNFWSVETLTDKLKTRNIIYKKRGQHLFLGVCLRTELHKFGITQEQLMETEEDGNTNKASRTDAIGRGEPVSAFSAANTRADNNPY